MIKFRNIIKGVSFLLCLGFLLCVGDASAATSCKEGYSWDEESNSCISDILLQEVTVTAKYTGSRCSTVSKEGWSIFNYLACRITVLVADIRAIVYVLAGFGMIAFAYGAIIGKINFKQLGNIAIGLFILSMTTSFIEYFVFGDDETKLQYGDYLPDGNHAQYFIVNKDCSNDPSLCPDAQLAGLKEEAEKSKGSFSIKDLKNSIKSAKNAVKTVADTVATVKNTVTTVSNAAKNIEHAVKNGGDITDVLNTVVTNVNSAIAATNSAATQIVGGVASVSGNLQNAGMTEEQRAYQAALEQEYKNLKAQCDLGNCSANQLKSLENLAAEVEANTTKAEKWAASDGKGGGSTILDALAKAAATTQKATGVASKVAGAKGEGQALGNQIGGGTLGDILGATYAATEAFTSGSDAIDAAKKDGLFDYRSEQKKAADKVAEEQAQCTEDGWNWVDGKCVDPNAEAKAKEAAEKAAAEAEAKRQEELQNELKRKECIERKGGNHYDEKTGQCLKNGKPV